MGFLVKSKMTDALHHFHKRQRIHLKKEPYPHPHKPKRIMDTMIYFVGISGPIMTIPQLTKIWVEKNASGVSVISWAAYLIGAIFWFIYGFMHKEKPIMLTYGGWIILEVFIVIGTILYG